MAFFRGQLLELARWITLYCQNQPGDGKTFLNADVRSTFVRAALIASHLWEQRLYGPDGIKANPDASAQLLQLLGAFRKSVEEGNQAGNAGFILTRGWLLFSRYLPTHLPKFGESFQQATGLTIRQYFLSASAILDRSFSDKPDDARIFTTQYVEGETPFREVFAKFISMHSQTPEQWAESIRGSTEVAYRALRERPILSFVRDRSIIFDPTFYLDNLSTAPLFRVMSQGIASNAVFGAFGFAFEDYALQLLRERFPSGSGLLHERLRCNVKGNTVAGQEFEADAVLTDITSLVVFEMKAAWIREATITASDPQIFLDEIRRKYGYIVDSDERPKGVAQLARIVGALVRREWLGQDREYGPATSVFPVLTVFDGRMGAPGTCRLLAEDFRILLGQIPDRIFVHPLIIMTAADLESLIYGVESLSLQEFLRAYSSADPNRSSSVHNFIAGSRYLSQVRSSPVLETAFQELMQAARAELSPH